MMLGNPAVEIVLQVYIQDEIRLAVAKHRQSYLYGCVLGCVTNVILKCFGHIHYVDHHFHRSLTDLRKSVSR